MLVFEKHTTTMASTPGNVPVDSSPTKPVPHIEFDPSYCKTFPGILKIVQVVLSLIGFICVQSVPYASVYSAVGWYSFVAMTAFWVSLILLFFYLFHVIERLSMIPWLLVEMGYCAIWTAFFFIAATVVASKGHHDAAFGAAAFFGFATMVAYGIDTFKKYQGWRSGVSTQGASASQGGGINPSSNTASSPSYPAY